ncbi:hypothetical protein WJX77_011268 [Trebouxia sp. C0004]
MVGKISAVGLWKMRTGFGMQTVLAEMDADEGPLSSSAAAAASQSDQSVQVLFWRSFAELGCGSSLVLDVQDQAHQQPVADAGPAQQPDAASQGHANQLGHCVQL